MKKSNSIILEAGLKVETYTKIRHSLITTEFSFKINKKINVQK